MALVVTLQGITLGEKHKSYNTIVNEAFKHTESHHIYKNAEETSGLDRLFKIDLAIKCKESDYIIDTLKCDDMLYVSRALKATWLITDDDYAHIISPEHLHTVLFPQMYNKAVCKLKFNIRQLLRNEERCQMFYEYHAHVLRDTSEAWNFLPYCSKKFIENSLNSEDCNVKYHVSKKQLKRICERYYEFAQLILENSPKYFLEPHHDADIFLFRYINFNATTQTEFYCDLVERFSTNNMDDNSFSKAVSKILAQNHRQNIFNRYDLYLPKIYPEYIAKYWLKDDIIKLLEKAFENKSMKKNWFDRSVLKRILKRIPTQEMEVILNKYCPVSNSRPEKLYLYTSTRVNAVNLHVWYKDLPFDTTFTEIKDLVRGTSTPDDRCTLLKALAELAGDNEENIYKVLAYYYNCHVNEMRYFKLRFLNALLDTYEVYKFSERCWKVVNDLFHSVETYGQCDYFIYNKTIIYYNILHNLPVPENVMEKYLQKDHNNVNHGIQRLDKEDRSEIFNFLNSDFELRCDVLHKSGEVGKALINVTKTYIEFIIRWGKDISQIPYLINLIKYIIKAKPGSLAYPKGRAARRSLFDESMLMSQDQEVIMNVLKHNPALIKQQYEMFERVIKTKKIPRYKRFFNKIVLYFHEITREFQATFKSKLKECEETSAAVCNITAGLSLLLNRNEFLSLINKYKPSNNKIDWSTENIYLINIRKGFAQNLYMVRPHVDMTTIYDFAKGDYLQFAVPSMLSVCISLPANLFADEMPKLLNSPVSVQKHGIRLTYKKLKSDELIPILENLWHKTRNIKIRCVIFQVTFTLLKEPNNVAKLSLWKLMKSFILSLKEEEDKNIFMTIFSKIHEMPTAIRCTMCKVCYKALKGASKKIDLSEVRNILLNNMSEWISDGDMDIKFVGRVLLENLTLLLTDEEINNYDLKDSVIRLFIKYLTSCLDENDQQNRYEHVAEPIFSSMVEKWNHVFGSDWVIRSIFDDILIFFCQKAAHHLKSNEDMISNSFIYENFLDQFEEVCGVQNNCVFYLRLNFLVFFEESVDQTELREQSKEKYILCGLYFSDKCGEFLTRLLKENFPSLHPVFCSTLQHFIKNDIRMRNNMDIFFVTSIIDNLVNDKKSLPENLLGLHFLLDRGNLWKTPDGFTAYYESVILRVRSMRNSEIQFHLNRKLSEECVSFYEALYSEVEDPFSEADTASKADGKEVIKETENKNSLYSYCTLL